MQLVLSQEEDYREADSKLVEEDMRVMTDFELHHLCLLHQVLVHEGKVCRATRQTAGRIVQKGKRVGRGRRERRRRREVITICSKFVQYCMTYIIWSIEMPCVHVLYTYCWLLS